MKGKRQDEMIAVTIGIIVVGSVVLIGILNAVFQEVRIQERSVTADIRVERVQDTRFIIKDIIIGEGREAVAGMIITTHYTGSLENGTVFDSSLGRSPFSFTLGVGQVIAGWDLGIEGMKVGGKRELTIPADLAYENRAIGPIPAGSTLYFEVELLEVLGGTQ